MFTLPPFNYLLILCKNEISYSLIYIFIYTVTAVKKQEECIEMEKIDRKNECILSREYRNIFETCEQQ